MSRTGIPWSAEERAMLSQARLRNRKLTDYYDIQDRGYETPCWVWKMALNKWGYGHITRGKTLRAHRWMYEELVGPIPDGMHLDHLCEVKACVNPDHLDPVLKNTNEARHYARHPYRATHCKNGHERTPANSLKSGSCLLCNREHQRRYKLKIRARRLSAFG